MYIPYFQYLRYEKVESRVIRQFERLGIQPEDPEQYTARHGNALLNTEDLLAQAKQLGIAEDLVCHLLYLF